MIHDKDYIIRMVRDFSNFLSLLILGKNEGKESDLLLSFDTQMKDVFRQSFEQLSQKSTEEIIASVDEQEPHHRADFYDLLANLFYYKYKPRRKQGICKKSQTLL